jgi:hypothetical protein
MGICNKPAEWSFRPADRLLSPEKFDMAKTKDTRAVGRKGGFKSFGSNLPQNAYKGKGMRIGRKWLTF